MTHQIYQVDAFAKNIFEGNPAAVVPLHEWLPDELMQKIATENNLSETAFFCPTNKGYKIRWFTPETEVPLCGHATLAVAHVLFNHLDYSKKEIIFDCQRGLLRVRKYYSLILMNFPAMKLEETTMTSEITDALNVNPQMAFSGKEDLMLVFENEDDLKTLDPDLRIFKRIKARGIICTAPSKEFDFVSRFFAPQVGIDEDHVTGSTHTQLIPYWAKRLNKTELVAKQISKRGGILYCNYLNDRVEIGGKAKTFLSGEIHI